MNNNDGKIIDVKPARSAGKIIAAVIIILALVIVILNSFTAVSVVTVLPKPISRSRAVTGCVMIYSAAYLWYS